jgi:hypothetical protein
MIQVTDYRVERDALQLSFIGSASSCSSERPEV